MNNISDAQLKFLDKLVDMRIEHENQPFFWNDLMSAYNLKSKFSIPYHLAHQLINWLTTLPPVEGQKWENPSEFDDYDIVGTRNDEFIFRDGHKELI